MLFVIFLVLTETELQFLNMLSDLVKSLPSTKIEVVLEKMKPLLKDGIVVPRNFETYIYGFRCFSICINASNVRTVGHGIGLTMYFVNTVRMIFLFDKIYRRSTIVCLTA